MEISIDELSFGNPSAGVWHWREWRLTNETDEVDFGSRVGQ